MCNKKMNMKMTIAEGNRGFTLIELMVTLGVSALLLSVGIPGFQGLIRDNRMTTQYNQFISGLNTARSEAVKRGIDVTICDRNANGDNCNNTGVWENGWIVFTDFDDDGVVDAGENILRVHEPLNGNNTLRSALAFDRNHITYNGQGFAIGFAGTFRLCDSRGARNAKGMVISANGRARRAIDLNADGVVEYEIGNSITCP